MNVIPITMWMVPQLLEIKDVIARNVSSKKIEAKFHLDQP
jgi:hypothetical protein